MHIDRVYSSSHSCTWRINVINLLRDQRYVMLQLKAICFVHSSGDPQIEQSDMLN